MIDLGDNFYSQEQYKKAQMLVEQCVDLRIITLGETHSGTLLSINRLGDIYCKLSDYDNALKWFQK